MDFCHGCVSEDIGSHLIGDGYLRLLYVYDWFVRKSVWLINVDLKLLLSDGVRFGGAKRGVDGVARCGAGFGNVRATSAAIMVLCLKDD